MYDLTFKNVAFLNNFMKKSEIWNYCVFLGTKEQATVTYETY